MIKIYRRTGDAGYQSYGADYEVRVGKAQALKLGNGRVPKTGWSVLLCTAGDSSQCGTLWLDNISGEYFIRSIAYTIQDWPTVYGYIVR